MWIFLFRLFCVVLSRESVGFTIRIPYAQPHSQSFAAEPMRTKQILQQTNRTKREEKNEAFVECRVYTLCVARARALAQAVQANAFLRLCRGSFFFFLFLRLRDELRLSLGVFLFSLVIIITTIIHGA